MAEAEAVKQLRERVMDRAGPLASVYLNVNNAHRENQDSGYQIRLKDSLKRAEMPDGVADRISDYFDGDRPNAKTVILFTDGDDYFEVHQLQIDLPEEVRWGEPFVAPLLLAIDEYERYGIILLDGENFRFFVSALGDIEEEFSSEHDYNLGEWHEVSIGSSPEPPQGGASEESWHEEQVRRFYKDMGDSVRRLISHYKVRRVIVAGPEARTAEFRRNIPQDVDKRVVAEESIATGASASEVLEEVSRVRERVESEKEFELLEQVRESGLTGVEDTLTGLNEGQIQTLLVPWPLDGEVRWDATTEMVITDLSQETSPYSEEPTTVRQLSDVLMELAEKRGARVEFVRGGANEGILRDEFGGLAGLRRF